VNKLLAEGLTDAAGFLAGGLVGFGIGKLLGWDIAGSGAASLGAILLCGLGGGAGVQLARRWRARRNGGK
jgi:F0F1-type ATP synthase assembly protein I